VHLLFEEESRAAALPDLILLDWNLPKVSGLDVLRRVKEHGTLRKIPVLVFSSSAEDDDIHSAYGAHANGFITKPGDNEALVCQPGWGEYLRLSHLTVREPEGKPRGDDLHNCSYVALGHEHTFAPRIIQCQLAGFVRPFGGMVFSP
jgi:CheY-like chemotaxis protein